MKLSTALFGIGSISAMFAASGWLGAARSGGGLSGIEPPIDPPAKPVGFAVVELFTSEGCSSCPAAEALLNTLHADAQARGTRLYTLAFHVDYWDGLGWPDRFATAANTARQRAYADKLGSGVYTPQMVVNGHDEFVGSDRDRAESAVAGGLAGPEGVAVTFEVKAEEGAPNAAAPCTVSIHAPTGAALGVAAALTQSGLSTTVKRGENAGRTLRHDGVVRAFSSATLDKEGRATVKLTPPASSDEAAKAEVVVWVYDAATGAIKGAAGRAWPAARR